MNIRATVFVNGNPSAYRFAHLLGKRVPSTKVLPRSSIRNNGNGFRRLHHLVIERVLWKLSITRLKVLIACIRSILRQDVENITKAESKDATVPKSPTTYELARLGLIGFLGKALHHPRGAL